MQIGKLDSKLLTDIVFRHLTFRRPEVLTRPGIGEDCAVVDFGTYDCVLSTDPITAAASDIGRLAMHISCNDIASNGVEPLAIMLAILLPPETTEEEIEEIMRQAGEVSEALGVEIVGGHTEITSAVNKPVVVSTALGRALKGGLEAGRGTKPGDWILVTKQAGLEGTGIIAREREAELAALLSQQELTEAKAMLEQISVVREGILAGRIGVLHLETRALLAQPPHDGIGLAVHQEHLGVDADVLAIHVGLADFKLRAAASLVGSAATLLRRAGVRR